MTEIRISLPDSKGCPMIIFHEELIESRDISLDLKFDNYELYYGYIGECGDCGGKTDITYLTVKRDNQYIFYESFNHHWILFLDISRKSRIKHEIDIKIQSMDDGDTCEICENNRFNFELKSIVDNFTYCFYSPPKGEFKLHLPEEPGELDEQIKEELK